MINSGDDVTHPAVCCPDERPSLQMINVTSLHEEEGETERQEHDDETQMTSPDKLETETEQQEEDEMQMISLQQENVDTEPEEEASVHQVGGEVDQDDDDQGTRSAAEYLAHKDACGISLVDNLKSRPSQGKYL